MLALDTCTKGSCLVEIKAHKQDGKGVDTLNCGGSGKRKEPEANHKAAENDRCRVVTAHTNRTLTDSREVGGMFVCV